MTHWIGDDESDENSEHEIWSEEQERSQAGVILIFALAPALVTFPILSFFLGKWLLLLAIPLLIVGYRGLHIWIRYRHSEEDPRGWDEIGDELFPGANRKEQLRNVALVMFGLVVVSLLANQFLPPLSEALWNWTIPWPWD